MTEISVRRAAERDVEPAAAFAGALARLHHQTDPARFFLPDQVEQGYAGWFRRVLKDAEAVLLVAEASQNLVGYAYGGLEDRAWNLLLDAHGAIHDLYVADTERRHGVGRALLAAMISTLEALGAERIVLSTMPTNHAAQSLFGRFGFRPTFLEMTRNRGAPAP